MFRITVETSTQIPCIEILKRGIVQAGESQYASHLVESRLANTVHLLSEERWPDRRRPGTDQQLKAPTPTFYIQYINSPLKGKLSSFSMREA